MGRSSCGTTACGDSRDALIAVPHVCERDGVTIDELAPHLRDATGAPRAGAQSEDASVRTGGRPPAVTIIGLVGCGSAKLRRPAPARDLYTGALFRKSRAYVEATCERWFVLSAKHGLVYPEQVLEPYDVRLGRVLPREPERSAQPIWQWAQMVADQLAVALADTPVPVLTVLAGEQYRTILRRCSWEASEPMKGLGIGEQLAWLNRELAALDRAGRAPRA